MSTSYDYQNLAVQTTALGLMLSVIDILYTLNILDAWII